MDTHDPSSFSEGPNKCSAWKPSGSFSLASLGSVILDSSFLSLLPVQENNNKDNATTVITDLQEGLFTYINRKLIVQQIGFYYKY